MKHLFKLKKDGKVVGYLELKGGIPSPETAAEKPLTAIAGLIWYTAGKTLMAWRDIELQWDTAHLLVTKGKNGKDVFAGDKVKANGIMVIVKWDTRECRYMLSTIPSLCEYPPALYDNMGSKFVWPDIELIEGKEDD